MPEQIILRRERWAIIRDDMEILCGSGRHFEFRSINDIGKIPIRTYQSERTAYSSYEQHDGNNFRRNRARYRAVRIIESFEAWN